MKKIIFSAFTLSLVALSSCRPSDTSTAAIKNTSTESSAEPAWDGLAILEEFNQKFDNDTSPNNLFRRVQALNFTTPSESTVLQKLRGCTIESIVLRAYDPVQKQDGGFQLRMYTPSPKNVKSADAKTVLLLPPTGGVNKIDLGYANVLCDNDIKTAILEQWDGDVVQNNNMSLKSYDIAAIQAVAAIRHAIEYLNPKPGQLGILGTSVGGMQSVLTMGYENRISAAALIVTGIGLREIIAVSVEENLTRLRNARFGAYCLDNKLCAYKDANAVMAKYKADIAANVNIEPGTKLGNSKVKNVWMAVAKKDLTVPTANQVALKDKLTEIVKANNNGVSGHLSFIEKSDDHVDTIMHIFLPEQHDISDFFNSSLIAQTSN